MSSARSDCRACEGSGELYLGTRCDYRGEPEEIWQRCFCVIKVGEEIEENV